MLGGLLLALFVDGVQARRHLGALHEVRHRLGLGKVSIEVRAPTFVEATLAFDRSLRSDGSSPSAWDVGAIVLAVGGSSLRMIRVPEALRGQTRQELVYTLLPVLPDEDRRSDEEVFALARVHRTESDRLLQWLLQNWAAAGFPSDLAEEMRLSLSGLKDWAAETGQDLTRFSWEEAVRRSEVWHRQFRVERGSPLQNGLVVLRWPDGWTLRRLLTKKEFADEGIAMGHCIGGPLRANGRPDGESRYWTRTKDDEGAVFSLRDPEGVAHATMSVVRNGGHFLLDDVEGVNNTALLPAVRLRLLSAYVPLGMFMDRRQMSSIAMMRSMVHDAILPIEPGEPDPYTDPVFTGSPWLTVGAETWRNATDEDGKKAGLDLILSAVKTFASMVRESPQSVSARRGAVQLSPIRPLGYLEVRPKAEGRGSEIQVFWYTNPVSPGPFFPTLYEAYLAVSGRPKVVPYDGGLYPDVSPSVRAALSGGVDIAGGTARGMGTRSSILAALDGGK